MLQYEGKRVIVTGAASGMGAATAQILVDLGAEVHAIDIRKPDIPGLASFTECDLRDPAQIDSAVRKIGKIVNALFNCADVLLVNFEELRHITEAVIPNMIEGSAIVSTAGAGDEEVIGYTALRSVSLAPHGIRINCLTQRSTDAEQQAWPLVFLNSPRASSLTGHCL